MNKPITELLAPIEARLKNSRLSEAPLIVKDSTHHKTWLKVGSEKSKHAFPFENFVFVVPACPPEDANKNYANAELIAHAPTDLAKLIAAIKRADEALVRIDNNFYHQDECSYDVDGQMTKDCPNCISINARADIAAILRGGGGEK